MTSPDNFVPELHDAGKLIDHRSGVVRVVTADGRIEPSRGGHVFDNIAWEDHGIAAPATESWLGIRHHHTAALRNSNLSFDQVREAFAELDRVEPLPPDDDNLRFRRRVLLSLADSVAASQSRVLDPGGVPKGEQTGVRVRLWNPGRHEPYQSQWSPIVDEASWREFIAFLGSPQVDAAGFYSIYGENLLLRAEDATAPRNLTSLYTHIRLVGQIYRVLDRHVTLEPDCRLNYGGQIANSQNEALRNWLFRLVQADIRVLQAPVRAKDLHVFTVLTDALKRLREDPDLRDYLLYSVGQTVTLLLPHPSTIQAPPLEDALGTWLETFAARTTTWMLPLDDITPDMRGHHAQLQVARKIIRKEMDAAKGDERQQWATINGVVQQRLEEIKKLKTEYAGLYPGQIGQDQGRVIEPDLCEICQLRHSPPEHQHETSYGGVEYLCPECDAIRTSADGHRLRSIAAWETQEETSDEHVIGRLAWVRLSLDLDRLQSAIQIQFSRHLNSLSAETPKQKRAVELARINFRPTAIIADFIDDYVELLHDLETWVQDRYTGVGDQIDDWQLVSRQESSTGIAGADFFVLRMTRGQQLHDFLKAYDVLLREYFPDMMAPCPIRIAVSLAPAKYPFYEHWRNLNQASEEVWLQMPGRLLIQYPARFLGDFLKLTAGTMEGRSSYLHNLAAIEARSGGSSILADLTFQHDLRQRDRKVSAELRQFATLIRENQTLTMSHLLGWYRLVTWGKGT